MNKKTLIITGVVVGLALIGVGVFFFTQREEATVGEDGENSGFFSFLFPSSGERPGGTLPTPAPGQKPEDGSSLPAIEGQPERNLIQLTTYVIAGADYNNTLEKIRYFKKASGHLYEITAQGTERSQLSITTISKIFEVQWLQNATTTKAVLHYPDPENAQGNARIFLANLLVTPTQEIEGAFLPLNSANISVSPNGQVFYLIDNGNATGVKSNFENTNPEIIFFSPFSEFLSDWPQENIITLLTKPSSVANGYLYKLNPNTQALTKILGNKKGLTALYSPYKEVVLYSESTNKSLETKLFNDTEKSTTDFNYKTLPEKCIWSKLNENKIYCAVPKNIPPAHYPDDWYKGIVSFEDDLWQIDLVNGATEILLNQGGFDIVNIFTNDSEDYIFFTNKKDGTLWSLRLTASDIISE